MTYFLTYFLLFTVIVGGTGQFAFPTRLGSVCKS